MVHDEAESDELKRTIRAVDYSLHRAEQRDTRDARIESRRRTNQG